VRASSWHALFHNSVLHSISDLHLNSESSDYLHVRSGPNDFLELQTGGSVIHCGQWHSRYISSRWTACKDAAGRQTERATSDRVAHYRRGVCRSLSVPNVFYSDVLSFRSIYRNLLQILGYVTKVQSIDRVSISRVVASLRERGNRAAAYAVRICIFGAEQHISKRHSPD
jgi:hypothetical protein